VLNRLSIPQDYPISGTINTTPLIIQAILRNVDGVPTGSLGFSSTGVSGNGYPYFLDARLFTEGVITSGAATSISTRKLINASDTFSTDGVSIGDWVKNTTSNTYAYVTGIDSEIQLSLSKDIFTAITQGYQVSDGFIQDARTDGTAFPSTGFAVTNKPIVELVKTLSQIEYTNSATERNETTGTLVITRGANFYIDKFNRFHWYVPDDTPELIMSVGTSTVISPDTVAHYIQNFDLNNKVRGLVNFIIFKVGTDMNNIMIKSFDYAKFSGVQ